jgi:hypothetical protein
MEELLASDTMVLRQNTVIVIKVHAQERRQMSLMEVSMTIALPFTLKQML